MRQTTRIIATLLLLLAFTNCEETVAKEEVTSTELKTEMDAKTEVKSIPKDIGAFLEISLQVNEENRPAAARVYLKYKTPFLEQIEGATSKELIMRKEDVQVLHGFETVAQANAYLTAPLFATDIVGELGPLLAAPPEVRIYSVFKE